MFARHAYENVTEKTPTTHNLRTALRGILCLLGLSLAIVCGVSDLSPALAHADLEEQIAQITVRIEQDPDSALLRLRRGELHRLHEDQTNAMADYRRARALDPTLALVDLGIGRLKLQSGDSDQALAALDRFLAAQPDDFTGLVARARARAELGDRLAAVDDFDRAIARIIDQGSRPAPEIYLERARMLRGAGTDHLPLALAGLDAGSVRLGHPITLEIEAIALERQLGKTEQALARVDRITRSSTGKESWLVLRGEILEDAGRHAESRQAYSAALAALENRPAHRRNVRALRALEEEVRVALTRVGDPESETRSRETAR